MPYIGIDLKDSITVGKLYSIHYFEYMSDFKFPGESHDFWEFVCVDKGDVAVTGGDRHIILNRGEVAFHQPGEFHDVQATGHSAPNLVVVSFQCDSPAMEFFDQRLVTVGDKERALLARMVEEADDAFSTPLDDPLLQQLERSPSAAFAAEQMVGINLECLLIELLRRGDSAAAFKPSSLIREKSQTEFIDKVCAYLEANINRRLTLSDICRDNLVGRSYLQKIFREKTGGGAMEYFGNLKIQKAKEMIREGSHNFTEIASLLGYNSIHYFSRHFKKVTGMTPSEYASSVKILAQKNGRR